MTPQQYIKQYRDNFRNRDHLINTVTVCTYDTGVKQTETTCTIQTASPIYTGKLFVIDDRLAYVTSILQSEDILPSLDESSNIEFNPDDIMTEHTVEYALIDGVIPKDEPLFTFKDTLSITKGDIENYNEDTGLDTTVGRFITNYLAFAHPFGDVFPYMNKPLRSKDIESAVMDALIDDKITTRQIDTYIANLFFIGHFTELSTPTLSRKALTVDPRILERKQQLLTLHADALKKGDPVTMAMIESELLKMDAEYLKDDPSMQFLGRNTGKSLKIHRKKMFLTHGMLQKFEDDSKFDFVDNSLSEGWTVENFPAIANDIRSGTYKRAKETAKGGEESKFLMRVFQNTRIVENDCGSTRGLTYPSFGELEYSMFLYRYVILANGEEVLVNSQNKSKLIGQKNILVRSPMYCKTKNNFCYKCCGHIFKVFQARSTTMDKVSIGSYFLTLSLKAFHGVSNNVVKVTSLNRFLLRPNPPSGA